ncbi:ATP-binding protein [Streptomyces sp. NPDC050315]|uniref:ATP-binding protein n=1 Tax=Streptomyces sp. NPDC050315 TaxID=3155039 RepID=UPI003447396D
MHQSRQQRFPRSRNSARAARDFAVSTLTDWSVTDRLEDIRLCVSELATNALLHGVPPGREFCVRLVSGSGLVRIEVRDSGDGRVEAQPPDTDPCSGRGLHLTQSLADEFGVTAHVVGKTVWVSFKVSTA